MYENNFPKSSFNKVAHVRNKAGESEYFCENANSVKLKKPAQVITLKEIRAELKDTPISTGEYMTKQCFWFNKKYMKQQRRRRTFIFAYKNNTKYADRILKSVGYADALKEESMENAILKEGFLQKNCYVQVRPDMNMYSQSVLFL